MRLFRRAVLLAVCVLVGAATWGLHAGGASISFVYPAAGEAAAATEDGTVVVRLRNKFFDPPVVVIHVGDTVTWVNETNGGWHDVNSYDLEFVSGRMDYGREFSHTFDRPGVFGYYCNPHVIDGMEGMVVVLPRGSPLPDPLPAPPNLSSSPSVAEPIPPGTPDTIVTVAGSGGSGGPATDASLYLPEGVAVDGAGNLYIADTENCQVRQVDSSGTIVSLIGHESCGYSMGGDADLGPWLHTNHPRGVSVGPDGAVYVADTINCRVRRVEEGGTVSTVAGTGSCGASGDGGPAVEAGLSPWGLSWDTTGNLYITDTFNCRVRMVDTSGIISTLVGDGSCGLAGDGGPAAQASLFFPRDVAVAPGAILYIADAANCRVRQVDLGSRIIETVAGDGSCSYGGDGGPAVEASLQPWALSVDSDGAVWVADRENCRLRRFVTGDTIDTVAGTGTCGFSGDAGPAEEATLNWPADVTVAADGSVFIADTGSCRVRRIDTEGAITTAAGNGVCAHGGDGGPATAGGAWHPMGMAMGEQGEWYFSELDTCLIRRIDAAGTITRYAGTGTCGYSGDGGPATEAELSDLLGGLTLAADGTLYIAEGYNCRVRRIDRDGIIDTVAGNGECAFSGDGGPAEEASLNFVSDVEIDGDGGLYVAEPFNCRVRWVDLDTGLIDTVVGDGSCLHKGEEIPAGEAGVEPWGVAVGPGGTLFLTDAGNCRVRRVDADGLIRTVAGGDECGFEGDGGPATQAQLMYPYDLALDRDGTLYFADLRTFTIRKVDSAGVISTVAGVGISRPVDIGGYDPTNGLLCSLHSLPIPVPSYLADGGPADEAGLYFPYGVTLGYDGHLYVADTFDHRVRRVTCGEGVPCAGPARLPAAALDSTAEGAPVEAAEGSGAGRPGGTDGVNLMAGWLLAGGGAALLGFVALAYRAGRRQNRL